MQRIQWFHIQTIGCAIFIVAVSIFTIKFVVDGLALESPIAYAVPAPKIPDPVEALHEPSIKVH
jgi:hypothetical protein